jgi:formylglycine-generating enzyme required for sulfatase activity
MKAYNGDPISQGGFTGEMSKYETTNAQYCQFLNSALASRDIFVHTDNKVYAAGDTSYSEPYFSTEAENSYSQIAYSDGTFSVRTRDGLSMADHPVVMVSWYGATAFADYYGWRLPTEWQWQAVADYDGSYTYGCGTTIDQSKANYYDANPLGLTSMPYTSPVGHYPAYGYGLCDMAGNVWEWTSTVSGDHRVLRGGGWGYIDNYSSVSFRIFNYPYESISHHGFRVCR